MNSQHQDVSPEDKRKIFEQRFAAVMTAMQQNVEKDPETIYTIGSVAAHLMDFAKVPNWQSYKAGLNQEGYNKLLNTLQADGNAQYQKGQLKTAFAIEVLAISVICLTQRDDLKIIEGEQMLDGMIADTIGFYRQQVEMRQKAKPAADPTE